MSKKDLKKIIVRVANADAMLPSSEKYEDFIAKSIEHKEWAEAIQALRECAKIISG